MKGFEHLIPLLCFLKILARRLPIQQVEANHFQSAVSSVQGVEIRSEPLGVLNSISLPALHLSLNIDPLSLRAQIQDKIIESRRKNLIDRIVFFVRKFPDAML
ncbi:hypothetical protein APR50_26830 [Variovorax paradoxus]|nr:hypothetical protein APR52_26670 [Variovorax paradoxus]KPV02618.1 hypothetical protein APR49_28590 [Variovorax paradoxus]KPV02655.1 hypothetical protein APR50_26830 [Variovorax paradoxus]KPV18682.1 hypothetical protein APR51_22830 [Variovorax paradoxus]KPV20056.1 hypothetical protein APR47_40105 [Variovorax paradoxus]